MPLTRAVFALFALCSVACGSRPDPGVPSAGPGKCDDFEQDIESFWSQKSRTEVSAGILQVGGAQTQEISYRVVTKMDELTRDWVMMQKGICKDTVEREVMTRETYAKVSLCLRTTLSAQRTLVVTLKHATQDHVFNVERAMADVQEDAVACQKEAIYSAYDERPDDTNAREARDKLAQAQVYRSLDDERAQAATVDAVHASERAATTRVKVDTLVEASRQATDQAEYDKALRLGAEAQGLATSSDYAVGIGDAVFVQALAHHELGQYDQALLRYEAALAIYRSKLGETNLKVVEVYGNILLTHAAREDVPKLLEAAKSLMATGALSKEQLQHADRNEMLRVMHLSVRLFGVFTFPMALPMQQEALDSTRATVGEKHPDTAMMHNNVGTTFLAMGNDARALESHASALAILRETVGEDHVLTADTYDRIGNVYLAQRKFDRARENYEAARTILLRRGRNLRIAWVYSHIGHVQVASGENDAALRSYEQALAVLRAILGDGSPRVAEVYHDMATVRSALGDQRQAIAEFERALAAFLKISGKDTYRTATVHFNMGVAYSRAGDDDRARKEYERSLAIRRDVLGEDDPGTAVAYLQVGRALVRDRKWGNALEKFKKALRAYRAAYGDAHRDTQAVVEEIEALCDTHRYGPACNAWENAQMSPEVAVPQGIGPLQVTGAVEFESGSSKLKQTGGTKRALNEVRSYLLANARVVKLRIEGHTSNVGDQKANLKLSGRRALAVKKALVDQGIPAPRLLAVGFGQSMPIADNASAEGRAKNNRVVFEIAEIDGPKQGVDPAAGGKVFE